MGMETLKVPITGWTDFIYLYILVTYQLFVSQNKIAVKDQIKPLFSWDQKWIRDFTLQF